MQAIGDLKELKEILGHLHKDGLQNKYKLIFFKLQFASNCNSGNQLIENKFLNWMYGISEWYPDGKL